MESDDGIYYVDVSDSNDPQIKKLAFDVAGVVVDFDATFEGILKISKCQIKELEAISP